MSIDFRLTNKFYPVGKFTNTESANSDDRLTIRNSETYNAKDRSWWGTSQRGLTYTEAASEEGNVSQARP